MTYEKDPRVDAYIDDVPDWPWAICQEVRDLVHAADPEVTETIKRRVQPYFVVEGSMRPFVAAKDHINVFLYDGGIVALCIDRADRRPEPAARGLALAADRRPHCYLRIAALVV